MKILQFVLLSIILGFSLQNVHAQDFDFITLNTDKNAYSNGEIISVYGDVNELLFGHEISLMVIAPNGNIISIEKLTVDSTKKFQTELIAGDMLMNNSGTYAVLAMYGEENGSAKSTFIFEQATSIVDQDDSKKNILLNFDFVNPAQRILEHVDYKITVSKNGVNLLGPTLIHSATGSESIPIMLKEGQSYDVIIEVNEIKFQSIPAETISFSIMTDSENIQSKFSSNSTFKINLAIGRDPSPDPKLIPEWIKNNANWWANGQINDDSFIQGIQYLVKEKIIDIPDLPYPASWMDNSVPLWVKNNASWWANDLIPEDDFIKGLKYLVEKGVIQI